MIPVDLMLSYLAKEQPERFTQIRNAMAEDEEKGRVALELFETEALAEENELTIKKGVYDQNVLTDKSLMREFEDRHTTGGVKYVDAYHSMQTLKEMSARLLKQNKILSFLVSKEVAVRGKITNQLRSHREKTPLAYEAEERVTGNAHYFVEGEKFDKKSFRVKNKLFGEFWMYQFNTGKKQYVLWSERQLDIKDYVIEGSLLEFEDFPLLGSTLRMNTMVSVIIVHTASSRVPVFENHAELINATKTLTRDEWMSWLFTHQKRKECYRQPALFETLMSSFLLSAQREAYLHLLIVGAPNSGKTTIEECIWQKFREYQGVVKCGQSTLLALVPSFNTKPLMCGALINASRIAVLDEFLRILLRMKIEDREHQLGRLNDLLDNADGVFSSGNGSITSRMNAKLLAVSNPIWYTNTMERLAEFADEAFLSRLFVWFQTNEHTEHVRSRQGKRLPASNVNADLFLGVFDYCQTFVSSYDEERVNVIFGKCRDLLAQDDGMKKSLEVFKARHRHHAECLLDGIVKTRCLTTQSTKFMATNEDYDVLERILMEMLVGWGIHALPKGTLR